MELLDIIKSINWVDLVVLILLFRTSCAGFNKGLGSQIFPLIGIYIALIIALQYYSSVGNFVIGHSPLKSDYSYFISYFCLAALVIYIVHLIESFIIGKIVTIHIVSLIDKIAGLCVGIVRGILLVSVVVIGLSLTPFDYVYTSVNEGSLIGKKFLTIGHSIFRRTTMFLYISKEVAN